MTLSEFNQLAKANLTVEQYTRVENMYMTADNMDKYSFCQDWKKHHDSELVQLFYDKCNRLQAEATALSGQISQLAMFMMEQAEKYSSAEMREKAIELLGEREYLTIKIQKGYNLWEKDRELIVSLIAR